MADDNSFHLFNLNTMSGIHPGSRTPRTHIVRLETTAAGGATQRWARILWPQGNGCALYGQAGGSSWQAEPFLTLPDAEGETAFGLIREALTEAGERFLACGECRWWQPIAGVIGPDGLAVGRCGWAIEGPDSFADENRAQSALALACPHWAAGAQPEPLAAERSTPTPAPKGRGWAAWWRRLFGQNVGQSTGQDEGQDAAPLAERSGVGAGTERCLACHGRIANLGALTVATESDDKRTLSVWRCRLCHTFYLNDWIDRWERLDSLETEDSYYRLAPAEAHSLLALFRTVRGGEHPGGRHSRTEQRAQMDEFLAGRPRLSHQTKQGR